MAGCDQGADARDRIRARNDERQTSAVVGRQGMCSHPRSQHTHTHKRFEPAPVYHAHTSGVPGDFAARMDVQAGRRRCVRTRRWRALFDSRESGQRHEVHVRPLCGRQAVRAVSRASGEGADNVGALRCGGSPLSHSPG